MTMRISVGFPCRGGAAVLGLVLTGALSTMAPAQDRFMAGRLSAEMRAALNASTDILGEQVLAGGEPSFERVAPIFPPFGRPRANVGVAEHRDEIGINWDGTIELARNVSFRLGDPPSPHGFDGPIVQSLLDGYLPVLITRWPYDGLEYELSVFGHSAGMSPTAQTDAYAALAIANPSSQPRTAHVTAYSFPALGGPLPRFRSEVAAGGRVALHFRIAWPVNADKLVEPIAKGEYHAKLAEVRSWWTTLLDRAKLFETPEQRVNDGALAWLMYNFLDVDTIDGRCEPHDGGRFYEEVYGYSAALYCHALTQFGFFEQAQRYLKDLLVFQKPDGQIRTSYGTPDNGAMLYAIGQCYRMSRNEQWFKQMLPAALRCCEWITQARAKTKTTSGEQPLTYGLLASGDKPYADFPGEAFSYYVDCYCWLGLRETGLALRDAGMKDEAQRWLTEADMYRQDILRSMEHAVIQISGVQALPIEPVTQRLIKQGGGDYYGIIAPMLLETHFFAADDARAEWITRPMERLGGLLLGVSRFADGIDHAYTYGYATTKLRAGDVDRFLLAFYTSLAHGMDRGTYSSVEVNYAPVGVNATTLPHLYSGTQQLRWLRMMHVHEENDELWLACGTPRAWLDKGQTIHVRRAPTVFGRVSYTIAADQAARTLTAAIGPLEQTGHPLPQQAVLGLRPPKGFGTLQSVTINGQEQATPKGERLAIEGQRLSQGVEVVARYR